MIELGSCDPDVTDAACAAYVKEVEQITRLPLNQVQPGADRIVTQRLTAAGPGLMSVVDVQRALKAIGLFPGAAVDGICGYRTLPAIRLFQQVRAVGREARLRAGWTFRPGIAATPPALARQRPPARNGRGRRDTPTGSRCSNR